MISILSPLCRFAGILPRHAKMNAAQLQLSPTINQRQQFLHLDPVLRVLKTSRQVVQVLGPGHIYHSLNLVATADVVPLPLPPPSANAMTDCLQAEKRQLLLLCLISNIINILYLNIYSQPMYKALC